VAGSAICGLFGGFVASPLFLIKTQLQTASSQSIAVGYQHKHASMHTAFLNIYKKGGIAGLFQGATSSMPRLMTGSTAQLLSYTYTMHKLNDLGWFKEGSWQSNLAGAFISGFCVVMCMNPFDVIATRLYNQPAENRLYNSYADCVRKVLRNEGPFAFYKGLTALYLRIGPHSFIQLVLWHYLRSAFNLENKKATK